MDDIDALKRCLELATEAVNAGDDAFGSLLVDGDGHLLREERNTIGGGDPTAHPEIALVRWAVARYSATERASMTVYTSGEHCAMCAAAHAWAGLGPIVFAGSTAQLTTWRSSWGAAPSPIRPLAISDVAPGVVARGPFDVFAPELERLHLEAERRRSGATG
ncbi:deaminase [Microbacterium sp. Leaf179]|uniref:deaminase n=1 Tax=Microbacterium sp. Leaf179 TaxID=1736288 RepID=UPI0006FF4A78|nr:deaminase [Microbacterium sp. Leaf179]KQR85701.1 cytidine deaminase [Microbacterium sp. Leaf179]